MYSILGHVMVTLGVSFVVSLCLEIPFGAMENVALATLFGTKTKPRKQQQQHTQQRIELDARTKGVYINGNGGRHQAQPQDYNPNVDTLDTSELDPKKNVVYGDEGNPESQIPEFRPNGDASKL